MLGAEDGEIRKADYIPMGRYTLPSEIANMCLFLASDKSKGIVGHILVADGGEILS
jgi:NAD(P)-dependent dehydrogenase (short-subunit alcohol dehydrogenase family)